MRRCWLYRPLDSARAVAMAGVIEGLIKVAFVCFAKDGAPDAGACLAELLDLC